RGPQSLHNLPSRFVASLYAAQLKLPIANDTGRTQAAGQFTVGGNHLPDAARRVPHRPAACPVAGRNVNRFGVIDPRLTGRDAEQGADGKTAEKTRDETISGGCWTRRETANGYGSRRADNKDSFHEPLRNNFTLPLTRFCGRNAQSPLLACGYVSQAQ